jgi:hypothetical protein
MWPKGARLASEVRRRGRNKYGAKRAALFPGGRIYASTLERDRAAYLRALELGGEIAGLREQVTIRLAEAVNYRADFVYVERGRDVAEDTKGATSERFAVICQLWARWGPCALRIVQGSKPRGRRRERAWTVREILPKGAAA